MRTGETTQLDGIFHALAHPIRRAVLESLVEGPKTVMKLAQPHDVSLNAVSKHLKALEAAGLVSRERDRTYHRLTLNGSAMKPAFDWLGHYADFWDQSLKALKRHIEGQ